MTTCIGYPLQPFPDHYWSVSKHFGSIMAPIVPISHLSILVMDSTIFVGSQCPLIPTIYSRSKAYSDHYVLGKPPVITIIGASNVRLTYPLNLYRTWDCYGLDGDRCLLFMAVLPFAFKTTVWSCRRILTSTAHDVISTSHSLARIGRSIVYHRFLFSGIPISMRPGPMAFKA